MLATIVILFLFFGMVLFYKIEQPIEENEHRKRIPLREIIDSFKGNRINFF